MEKSAQFKMLHLLFQCKLILLSDSSLEIICTLIVQVLGNKKKMKHFVEWSSIQYPLDVCTKLQIVMSMYVCIGQDGQCLSQFIIKGQF